MAAKKSAAKKRAPQPKKKIPLGFVLERIVEVEVKLDEFFDLRIELLRNRAKPNIWRARLSKFQLVRIQSANLPAPSEELILKEWSYPEAYDSIEAKDVDAAEKYVFARIDHWLANNGGSFA